MVLKTDIFQDKTNTANNKVATVANVGNNQNRDYFIARCKESFEKLAIHNEKDEECTKHSGESTVGSSLSLKPHKRSSASQEAFDYMSFYFSKMTLVPQSVPAFKNKDHLCYDEEDCDIYIEIEDTASSKQNHTMSSKFTMHDSTTRSSLDGTTDSSAIIQNCSIRNTSSSNCKYACKHSYQKKGGSYVLMPRSYQHHVMSTLLKFHYEHNYDYKIYKNFQCPPSRCSLISPVRQDFSSIFKTNDHTTDIHHQDGVVNIISWRYSRTRGASNTLLTEYLCRYCKGKNWIENTRYFEHLFFAHGIMTELSPHFHKQHGNDFVITRKNISTGEYLGKTTSASNLDSKNNQSVYYAINESNNVCKILKPQSFLNRNLLSHIEVKLLPLPLKIFQDYIRPKKLRIFCECPYCFMWVRCGFAEHDHILVESLEYEQLDPFRGDAKKNLYYTSITQNRSRSNIRGIYENYFIHLINDCMEFKIKEYYRYNCLFLEG